METTADQVSEQISKATTEAKKATAEQKDRETLGRAEQKRRKAEEIKSIPPIPLCPGIKVLGSSLFTDVTGKGGTDKAVAVWSWWHRVASEFPDRLTTYVTRLHPAQIEKPKGERSEETIYGFPDYEFEEDYGNLLNWILQRHGSGSYRFYINDTALRTGLVVWSLNGIWEDKHPPVMDLKDLDIDHANNKHFVAELRRKQLIAAQTEPPKGPTVADATVLSTLQQQQPMTVMAQTIATLAKDNRANQPDPAAIAESVSRQHEKINDFLIDTVKKTRELEQKGKDPGDHVDQLIKVAQLITPKAPPPVDVAAIMRESREAQAETRKATDQLAAELRERDREDRKELLKRLDNAEKKPPEDPLASMRNGLSFMKEMKDLFGPDKGGDDEDSKGNGREPWWADLAKAVIPAVAPLVGLAVQAGVKYLGNSPQQQQVQQQPGMVQQPQQIAQPQQEQPVNQEVILWSYIKGKMQHDYQAGKTGIDFACWFLDQNHLGLNQTTYAQIAGTGRDAVLTSMMTYAPDVWEQVKGADGKPQPAFELFLNDFLDQQAVAQARGGGAPDYSAAGVVAEEHARTPEIVEDLPRVKRVRTMPKGGVA